LDGDCGVNGYKSSLFFIGPYRGLEPLQLRADPRDISEGTTEVPVIISKPTFN
jgi:hypothetical protein